MITYGDFNTWCTQNLHRSLEKVINANQHRENPYYLLVIIKDGYEGPPAGIKEEIRQTRDIDLSGKKVMRVTINIMSRPPIVKMLGSLLWRVDNGIGQAECLYALPPDIPIIGPEGECDSELVFKSGQGMPLVYNRV